LQRYIIYIIYTITKSKKVKAATLTVDIRQKGGGFYIISAHRAVRAVGGGLRGRGFARGGWRRLRRESNHDL
jgi:predicted deacylase